MMKLSTTKRLERLHQRYANGDLSRRTFLTLTAAAASARPIHGVDSPAEAAAAAVSVRKVRRLRSPFAYRSCSLSSRFVVDSFIMSSPLGCRVFSIW